VQANSCVYSSVKMKIVSLPSITVTVVKKAFMNLSLSKNNLNATLKKTGRLDKMIVFCVLTIVMTIVYDFVVTL